MKKLGLIGGISWVSTLDYYKYINEGINAQLGGLNFSECIIYSFNYADIKKLGDIGDWDAVFELLLTASTHLKNSGAEGLVLCANTMHYLADRLQKETGLPVIHIADATAKEIKKQGISKVGLLGTKPTMTLDFYKDRLNDFGISTLIPNEEDREFVHFTIFEELGRNIIKEETKTKYLSIIKELQSKGAEGIILGCTEIPMLIMPKDVAIPIFDTVRIHANASISFSLAL